MRGQRAGRRAAGSRGRFEEAHAAARQRAQRGFQLLERIDPHSLEIVAEHGLRRRAPSPPRPPELRQARCFDNRSDAGSQLPACGIASRPARPSAGLRATPARRGSARARAAAARAARRSSCCDERSAEAATARRSVAGQCVAAARACASSSLKASSGASACCGHRSSSTPGSAGPPVRAAAAQLVLELLDAGRSTWVSAARRPDRD